MKKRNDDTTVKGFKNKANENMENRFRDYFSNKSDEEIELAAMAVMSERIKNEMYTETGINDITQNCNKLVQKIKNIPFLGEFAVNVNMLCLMLKAIIRKEYKIPNAKSVTVTIIAALAYVVAPVDLIPDTIAGIGYIDDMQVVNAIMIKLRAEIENFKYYLDSKNHNEFCEALFAEQRERENDRIYYSEYEEETSEKISPFAA